MSNEEFEEVQRLNEQIRESAVKSTEARITRLLAILAMVISTILLGVCDLLAELIAKAN